MSRANQHILTIGHSTHPLEAFVTLLERHGVTVVADVRSTPYSRSSPQFNMERLDAGLKARGIQYLFLGRELGARSADPSCYVDGRVQYGRLAASPLFHRGIEQLAGVVEAHLAALMCAEREPLECHRTILVAPALLERGLQVDHILADGRLEPHAEAMVRLLDLVGLPREDLFRSRDELIALALARQEARVAYFDPKLAAELVGGRR